MQADDRRENRQWDRDPHDGGGPPGANQHKNKTPAQPPAISISWTTSSIESFTKVDASLRSLIFTPSGDTSLARGIIFLIPSTTSRVEASVLFIAMRMTVCLPFTSTEFCWTRPMRRTEA